jgi:hypothetical protein
LRVGPEKVLLIAAQSLLAYADPTREAAETVAASFER